MNSPRQPDPMQSMMLAQQMAGQSAQQQAQLNSQAAQEQQRMNMTSQSTPYGSLTYAADASSPSGYRATQSYSQPIQDLLNSNIGVSQGASNTAQNLLQNQGGALGQGVDLSYGANASRIADLERQTLDPMWQRNQNAFDQSMANRGVMPGSAAYDNSYRDFNTSRNDAYNNMFLNAYNTANNAAAQQYNTNLNGLNALQSGGQIAAPVSSMGLTSTPQESIQSPDYSGTLSNTFKSMNDMQQQQYQNQLQQNNATLGGLFGLGGAIAGGVAGGPLGSSIGSGLGRVASYGLGLSSPFPSSYSG
jgi:hypothetical protein